MLWTSSGTHFGRLVGRNLRTHDGYHVGCVVAGEVFGPDGLYLGEITAERYLVKDLSKSLKRRKPFKPFSQGRPILEAPDIKPLEMGPGFVDFLPAAHFRRLEQEKERAYVEDLLRGYVEQND